MIADSLMYICSKNTFDATCAMNLEKNGIF